MEREREKEGGEEGEERKLTRTESIREWQSVKFSFRNCK